MVLSTVLLQVDLVQNVPESAFSDWSIYHSIYERDKNFTDQGDNSFVIFMSKEFNIDNVHLMPYMRMLSRGRVPDSI